MLRHVAPIAGRGAFWVVTRYDDVREVFATDSVFGVPYAENLAVITGGAPFFLGLPDSPAYRAQLAAMQAVMRPGDLARLGDAAEARAAALLAGAGPQVDVVAFVRQVTFGLLGDYLGVPEPDRGSLATWGTRLFVFQFTGSVSDAAWRNETQVIATALRTHIDAVIEARKSGRGRVDDVLERCLALQDRGVPGYGDVEIRTALLCMIVGGPPQPPMVLPQAMEQLLRRPDWLARARRAARRGDDADLHAIVIEAMRFDPLAPGLPRKVLKTATLAAGTAREREIPEGATVIAAFASAMMDASRIPEPGVFNPNRLPHEYIHFGHGLHECFGRFINHATLHRMLKPLLAAGRLGRAPGVDGHLRKRGAFADRLLVSVGA
ncbi:cytochrome P450 [Methylobacterium sp. DB0501]|uniref:cytochrome P450 n=1 Tax=Methylobacterium sp. DB0501 TaxID=2709665 RepID=UPI0013EAC3D4|nr:cytochrome P450 [Methylobacterium sp. DB0501]NGM35350.1 cytochrome P450 [Methylobacterium sp. DB0501]